MLINSKIMKETLKIRQTHIDQAENGRHAPEMFERSNTDCFDGSKEDGEA